MPGSIALRTVDGGSAGSVTLDEALFGIQPNVAVMHQVVTAQLAAARSGTQSTKTRSEVRGGGKKPFKQKGTGRARQGSTRAPHWAGGGVALGPKPRSYRQKTPKKMVQLALRSALSDRASAQRVVVVDGWPWEEPKTAEARRSLEALGLDGRVLIVLARDRDDDARRSFRNLPSVHLLLSSELNAYDVLCCDWIVFSRHTLPGAGSEVVDGPAPEAPETDAVGPEDDDLAEEVAVEDIAVEDIAVEDVAVEDVAVEDVAVEGVAAGDVDAVAGNVDEPEPEQEGEHS